MIDQALMEGTFKKSFIKNQEKIDKNNKLNYNSTGISMGNTYNTIIEGNTIHRSINGIVLDLGTLTPMDPSLSINDTIINDSLKSCSSFNIQNLTPINVQAINNFYGTNDTSIKVLKSRADAANVPFEFIGTEFVIYEDEGDQATDDAAFLSGGIIESEDQGEIDGIFNITQ